MRREENPMLLLPPRPPSWPASPRERSTARSSAAVPQFTPDGTHLIASYDNGRAYLWDLRPERLLRQACHVAGRRLTREEWAEFLPDRDYDPAC
jgi:hypothetical protein